MNPIRRVAWLALVGGIFFLLSSCSPFYVVQAGWEEARILWRREPITELINRPETDEVLRGKLRLVLQARDFAEELGLKPEGSFTKYSKIDRDVLLWVLSASSKVALRPVTWWFPIVGSIPYKGFFEKADGERESAKLVEKDLDVFLRPSAAFSTLGWLDDPLLSTTVRFDEVALANTVIHEILHNTIWIPDNAPFNESLANFVGSRGAEAFFRKLDGPQSTRAEDAVKRWKDDLDFAHFLEQTINDLKSVYVSDSDPLPKPDDPKYKEIIARREPILQDAIARWQSTHGGGTGKQRAVLNNAVIIAYQIYLTRPWLFEEEYELTSRSMPAFIADMKRVAETIKKKKLDPYAALESHIAELRARNSSSPM